MTTKFVRFVAALAVVISIIGITGIARADHGAPSNLSLQNLESPRAPEPQPLDITPASSLGVQFVHVATAANILAHSTIIDHPLTNGNPNAIIFVTPNLNPGGVGGTLDDHPISVYYDGSKWRIFNQDGVAMPVGAAFNVIIPTASAGVFVHTATAGSITGSYTDIDNALTNGHPNAIVFITPDWNPGGVCGGCAYNNHPIGVFYNGNKWAIFNQDLAPMPVDVAFNVFVLTAGVGVFIHTATAGNINGDSTAIDNALTNGHPNAIVFVTPDLNPGGVGSGTVNNHNLDVYYNTLDKQWKIFNQDSAAMPNSAAFNVLVLVPSSDFFVHTATIGTAPYTIMDNALTNGHPNAVVFVTPNYNPGGVGGTGHNNNFGMFYAADTWRILNQTSAHVLVGAAFNVLVPNPDTSVFVHNATAANILSHSTIIDYPLTNGHPNAIILVTLNWNPGGVGGIYNNSPIGVFYDGIQWRIFNQDSAAMPVNAAFNVFVPTAGESVFVHTATVGNTSFGFTTIDNVLANGNPNALIVVTPNWNPGGVGGTNENHPIGVWYSGSRWTIFNQDGATMPLDAAFNVYVSGNYKSYLPLVSR
jgi:hypothetical protein